MEYVPTYTLECKACNTHVSSINYVMRWYMNESVIKQSKDETKFRPQTTVVGNVKMI